MTKTSRTNQYMIKCTSEYKYPLHLLDRRFTSPYSRLISLDGSGSLVEAAKVLFDDPVHHIPSRLHLVPKACSSVLHDIGVVAASELPLGVEQTQALDEAIESLASTSFITQGEHGLLQWNATPEHRGNFGETPLHVCTLVNSELHSFVAVRLLRRYPPGDILPPPACTPGPRSWAGSYGTAGPLPLPLTPWAGSLDWPSTPTRTR